MLIIILIDFWFVVMWRY